MATRKMNPKTAMALAQLAAAGANQQQPMPPGPAQVNTAPGGMPPGMKKGGKVKKMAKGGSASSRADGIAERGKTKGKYI